MAVFSSHVRGAVYSVSGWGQENYKKILLTRLKEVDFGEMHVHVGQVKMYR